MENLFVPYEIALVLKELGFDEPCNTCYDKLQMVSSYGKNVFDYKNYNTSGYVISRPTFSQAFRFFREKYGLHYIICKNIQMDGYGYREVILPSYMEENENTIFKTYEEAELECIKKLIEICKKN